MTQSEPLIALEQVCIRRSGLRDLLVDSFSLTVAADEVVVLLGEESGGGDAILRAIANSADNEEQVTGSILYHGKGAKDQIRLAYLPSALSSPLSPSRSIASQLERVVARKFSLPRSAAREELRSALSKLNGAPSFESLSVKPDRAEPATVAWALLAATVAQAPELILADDPVRGLSPAVAHALTSVLLDQRKRLNAALLYNARALDGAIWASNRVVVMRHGALIEEGPAERLASGRTHSYTRTLFRALPPPSGEQPPRKFARGETVLRVQGLRLTGDHQKSTRMARLSFELRRGASLALVGEEGSGRRKLVRTILGLEPVNAGHVVIDSVDVGILSTPMKARLRRRVAMVSGSDDVLDPRMTVRDTVDEPLRAHLRLPRDAISGHRELAMKRVGLPAQMQGRRVASLSAFDKRRLQIARAIVSAPMLAIIDEPLRGLDAFAQTIIRDLLADFREQEGSTFLVITADLAIAQALAEDALVFKDGQVVERGPMHDLIRAPKEAALQALIQASLLARPAMGEVAS